MQKTELYIVLWEVMKLASLEESSHSIPDGVPNGQVWSMLLVEMFGVVLSPPKLDRPTRFGAFIYAFSQIGVHIFVHHATLSGIWNCWAFVLASQAKACVHSLYAPIGSCGWGVAQAGMSPLVSDAASKAPVTQPWVIALAPSTCPWYAPGCPCACWSKISKVCRRCSQICLVRHQWLVSQASSRDL